MVIHEFVQAFHVETPLGKGVVLFVTDYGWNTNVVWTVTMLEDGTVRHFQTTQIKFSKDHVWNIAHKTPNF
jgi:hypothetical protein